MSDPEWPSSWPGWVILDLVAHVARGWPPALAVRVARRRWAVARRWAEDAKPCDRCGLAVLERWEREAVAPPESAHEAEPRAYSRPVRLDRLAREHACARDGGGR